MQSHTKQLSPLKVYVTSLKPRPATLRMARRSEISLYLSESLVTRDRKPWQANGLEAGQAVAWLADQRLQGAFERGRAKGETVFGESGGDHPLRLEEQRVCEFGPKHRLE